ncbi:MAG: GHMP kinase [Nitrospirae bacterium]|nr:GHMP kinase [Nitrospirota bacterium]
MLITQTPLRVSFFGGGTDQREFYRHTQGCVLSTTIDKYLYVILKERYDKKFVVSWSRKESVESLDEIQHQLVREALRLTTLGPGIEVVTVADIPSEGSGLGSSSTLTVGLLNAFWQFQGETKTPEELARQAVMIEADILRKPVGKQDHYAAAYGNLRTLTFSPNETVTAEKVALPEPTRRRLENNLLLFYTNRTRSADPIISEQKANTESKKPILSRMRDQVALAQQLLQGGDLDGFGRLLHEAWTLKKQLAGGITTPDLDRMYQTALDAGALGGKILGAGGGGFLLVYSPMERQDAVRHAMTAIGYGEMPFRFERDGTKVIFNVRRDSWKVAP